ncbi:extracellular solute-binding protein [Paenibacillus silviterrae]|uniref:extracellular solute-binding protein n=1 Tax=Paenibacillus silviterrae TaxID=3242194 RepID=UPI002542C892|nr:extracellular solute-binding protein [Paenibacillus chinjuensis]
MSKSLTSLLATSVAFSLLVGCANSNTGSQSNQGTTEAPKGPTPITIMANLHTPEVPNQEIEKLLEERTNTNLTIQWVPDGSYDEKLNAAFATGGLPQAVFMRNQTSLLLFREAFRSNQFWEIGPYLKDYPNLKNLDPKVLNNTSVDGKIYALYQERPLSKQGIIYRKDWADALGIPAPKTIDDLYNMAKAFTEKDPDKNGKNDTIGFTDRNDLIYGAFKTISSYFGTPNNWAVKDGKIIPEFEDPAYMETLKWFQKLHKEGLINKDFPATSKNDQQNLFNTGKAGIYVGSLQDVTTLQQKLSGTGMKFELDVLNRIEGPKGPGVWALPGFISAVIFPKSAVKTEAELKSILTYFDKLMAPENTNLIFYGMEGKHYTLKDGKAEVTSDVKLWERDVKAYQALMIGGESTIKMLEPTYTLPVRAKAEQQVKDNNSFLIHDPTPPLDSKTYTEKGLRLQEIIKDATYKFILGGIDEAGFRKEVEKWKTEGGQKIMDEYTASYQAVNKK